MTGYQDKQDDNPDLTNNATDESLNEHAIIEEYDFLDSKLDELNSALDTLEQKNDDIHKKLKELLQSNRDIRQELINENNNKKE